MPKSEFNDREDDETIARLLMPASQHINLFKKAGAKNIPPETVNLYREEVFPSELREFVRRMMVVTDYTGMKTVMPKHVSAAYKSMTGKALIYTRHAASRSKSKVKSKEPEQ